MKFKSPDIPRRVIYITNKSKTASRLYFMHCGFSHDLPRACTIKVYSPHKIIIYFYQMSNLFRKSPQETIYNPRALLVPVLLGALPVIFKLRKTSRFRLTSSDGSPFYLIIHPHHHTTYVYF